MPLILNICLRCSSVIKNLTLLTFSIEILMSRKWWWSTVIRFADGIKLVIISPVSVLKDRVVSAATLTGWSKGPTQTSLKSTSKNGKEKPSEQYSLGKAKSRSSSVEKDLGTLAGSELSTGQLCAVHRVRTNSILGCVNRVTVRKPRKQLFLLCAY